MATRSSIALELPDGTVQMIYCHWDGSLDHNGRILQDHYTDPFKVQELLSHGDMSSLGSDIGERHPIDNPHAWGTLEYIAYHTKYKNWCKFYMRDGDESDCEATTYNNFTEYLKNSDRQEFNYVLRNDGKWYVYEAYDYVRAGYVPLILALSTCEDAEYNDE